ncbi:OsmC family protein [Cellulomonas fimi]|uniref:OsmC family protein n=1 Tax=Cellulomonas fimi TaxID=1708 RepID=A0A7Y0QHP0_CELFI|nr:OsmC family protein [Cellulomonas fimi]NMR20490.1 OsmC family protein [Cellulomonas fimi]
MTAEPVSEPASEPASEPTPAPVTTALWVERTGTRRFTGHSSRGAEVLIGPTGTEGAFSPGELLKIALAACSGMSADAKLAHRLGDDFEATVTVEAPTHPTEDRYPHFREELVVDLSGLDVTTRDRLLTVVHRAIEQHCTVGRTLEAGATVELTVTGPR